MQWSSELNLPIPVHFSSLIPKMIFSLAISCLTTSNLPWFKDLIFQVPMQCCSLHHQTLLPSPVTSTTGCCFALAPSLHSLSDVISPLLSRSILGTYWSGELLFQWPIFLPFHCSWGSQGKSTEVVCYSLLQWTTFCQNSQMWPIHLGWPCLAWFIVSLS